MDKRLSKAISAALFGALMGSSTLAGAAGFAIIEHSAQGMGDAFASGGAAAEDASGIWFNPATLAKLGNQMQFASHLIVPSFDFTDTGSRQVAGAGTIPLLAGSSTSEDGGVAALVPNFYYARKINDKFNVGIAVNAPFGLSTAYDPGWKGRYQTVDSRITTLNINPAVSFRVNNQLTFGAGVSANYIDARLTNTIDFTAVCAGSSGAAAGACTGFAGGAGLGQGANDGFVENKADDLSFGFNAGLLYEIDNDTRISVAYRSEIHHKLDGKAKFSLPTTISAFAPAEAGVRATFADDGISIGATLPDSFSVSAYHKVHPKLAILGDATWTGWSDIPDLRIIFDRPGTAGGAGIEALGWDDTWRLAVGMHYYHNDRLTFRTGVAFDESPTPGAVLRTARLPDNDRIWVSFGGSYKLNDKMSADVGFSHLFINDTHIARVGSTGSILNGVYKSSANIFSAQFNYRFD